MNYFAAEIVLAVNVMQLVRMNCICVFASGSDGLSACYYSAARELGALIGSSGKTLVCGGAKVGLTGTIAESVQKTGGRVIGVIPRFMYEKGLAYDNADELVVVHTMRERKNLMEERADAFIAMPGGFGTVEEIMEILALRQLAQHYKPIVFLNTNEFYQPLIGLFERMIEGRFARSEYRNLYHIASTPKEVWRRLRESEISQRT